MFQTLRIFQIVLFAIPMMALIGVGLVILLHPISVISRRWMLLVFLPLLLANSVAIFANETLSETFILRNWRLWLIVLADIGLTVGIIVAFRGYSVYGLNAETVSQTLADEFQNQGYGVEMTTGEKRLLGSGMRDALVISVSQAGRMETIWVITGSGEVVVRADHRGGMQLLKSAIGILKAQIASHDFRSHVTGALYLIFAIVFALLSWIFFFEPRLILIE